jgi:acetyl-CoA/propionyl-CoA carboxylase carboxyl transferase subunit
VTNTIGVNTIGVQTAVRREAATCGALPPEPGARLAALFDPGSLRFLVPPGDCGAVSGAGTLAGTPAAAFANDPRVQGGAMGTAGCAAIVAAYERALSGGAPVIGLWHSGGARLREGAASLHAVGTVFNAMTQASGLVPQISVVLGPAAGGAAYGPALTDIVIMVRSASIFVTGPGVVRSVTGEDVDMARLGGPGPHSRRSGLAHLLAASAQEALSLARRTGLLLAEQGKVDLSAVTGRGPAAVPAPAGSPECDVKPLLRFLLDGPGLELHPAWAASLVTVLGRLAGRTVGVVASNPSRLGGFLDAAAADKAARFVRMCDAFGVPLIVLVNTPGYLPGTAQERGGLARRGAKLMHAFAAAVVPRVTVVTGQAFGSAAVTLNSRALGATRVFAWPGARFGPGRADGLADETIHPAATREAVARAIALAPCGRGAHRNIPL